MRFFRKKENVLTRDKERQLANAVPEEIKEFFNDQIYSIEKANIFLPYNLFYKNFTRDKQEIAGVSLERYLNKLNGLIESKQLSKEAGEMSLGLTLLLKIDQSSILWICPECRQVIGLFQKPPSSLLKKHPSLLAESEYLSQTLRLYARNESLFCPSCTAKKWMLLKPTFLISGIELDEMTEAVFDLDNKKEEF